MDKACLNSGILALLLHNCFLVVLADSYMCWWARVLVPGLLVVLVKLPCGCAPRAPICVRTYICGADTVKAYSLALI